MPGVGRLEPVEGVTVRPHPDRELLLRFLQELQMPLAVIDSFLELAGTQAVPAPVREALSAVADNARYLGDLVGDYRDYALLEADRVVVRPTTTSPLYWLEGLLAPHVVRAEALGLELEVVHRSFLPDAVVFDVGLAAHALDAVIRTALYRALPGPVVCRVAYAGAAGVAKTPQLSVEVQTRGGGFPEIEQGYAFLPFAASDTAQRPLLGLSVARRLCHLLGGQLTIDSAGPAACSYRMSIQAPPAASAAWIDPLAGTGHRLGTIGSGRILFAERGQDSHLVCGGALRGAGYEVGSVDGSESLLQRLVADPVPAAAIVVAIALLGDEAPAFVNRVRATGFAGAIVLVDSQVPAQLPPPGCDAVLAGPWVAGDLLGVLTSRRLTAPSGTQSGSADRLG